MALADTYKAKRLAAVIGPGHSPLIPDVLWIGWLDTSGDLVGTPGATVSHAAFEVVGDTVTNSAIVNAGVAPASAGTITHLAVLDGSNELIVPPIPVTFASTPTEGDPITFEVGSLVLSPVEP